LVLKNRAVSYRAHDAMEWNGSAIASVMQHRRWAAADGHCGNFSAAMADLWRVTFLELSARAAAESPARITETHTFTVRSQEPQLQAV
jgi:hypothetical protein